MYNVQLASKHLAQVETAEIDLHHIEITKQTNHPAQDLGEPEAAMLAGGHLVSKAENVLHGPGPLLCS